jgi:hypothetical protein
MYVRADDTWQTSSNCPCWEADGWVSDEDWIWNLERGCYPQDESYWTSAQQGYRGYRGYRG